MENWCLILSPGEFQEIRVVGRMTSGFPPVHNQKVQKRQKNEAGLPEIWIKLPAGASDWPE